MLNFQKYLFINLLLNGVRVNNIILKEEKLEIKSNGFSYNWGEDLLTQYNKPNIIKNLQKVNYEKVFIYNNIQTKFATKVHDFNRKQLLENIDGFKQYGIQNIDIPGSLAAFLDKVNVPVVVLVVNFNGLKIVQAIPETLGMNTKWFFKEINVKFESYNLFASKIFKKLEAFLAQNLSLSEIYNIMYNYVNFPVLQSTNNKMLDILRSILLELLVETLEHTDIPNFKNGLLVVTGEMASLFGYKEYAYLSLIDGLLLNGLWGVFFDANHIFLNLLYLKQNNILVGNFDYFNFFVPYLDIFYLAWNDDVPILEIGYVSTKKFIGKVNHLTKYTYKKKANMFYSKNSYSNLDNKNINYYELVLPSATYVENIIIDNRERPISYGPGPLANSSRVYSNLADLIKHEF